MDDLTMRVGDELPNRTFIFKRENISGVLENVDLTGYSVTADGRFVGATTNRFTGITVTVSTAPTNGQATLASLTTAHTGSTGDLQIQLILTSSSKVERAPRNITISIRPSFS